MKSQLNKISLLSLSPSEIQAITRAYCVPGENKSLRHELHPITHAEIRGRESSFRARESALYKINQTDVNRPAACANPLWSEINSASCTIFQLDGAQTNEYRQYKSHLLEGHSAFDRLRFCSRTLLLIVFVRKKYDAVACRGCGGEKRRKLDHLGVERRAWKPIEIHARFTVRDVRTNRNCILNSHSPPLRYKCAVSIVWYRDVTTQERLYLAIFYQPSTT